MKRPRMFEDYRLFLSELKENFTTLGAIVPSSPHLAKAIVMPLSQRGLRPVRVLEVGPGTGAFTDRILKHLRRGDVFDIYELSPKFCGYLRRSLPFSDLRKQGIQIRLINDDIRNLRQSFDYHYIISGLPLNNFDSQIVSDILEVLISHLSPDGVLSYFEYIFTHEFKARFLKPSERQRMIQVAKTVGSFIARHQYAYSQVWWNLPPAKARYCKRA
ncbi:MAG: hypothetical protein AB1898_13715 [Acidobacteriota bacterium]